MARSESIRLLERARSTRARISAEESDEAEPRNSWKGTAGTSTWISMRSSSGPLIFPKYCWICPGVQRHSRVASQ